MDHIKRTCACNFSSGDILLHGIDTVFRPMEVLKGTASLAGATLSGRTVGAPIALAMASERPWSTAAKTATVKVSTKTGDWKQK
jgi:hypothetical protein